MLRHFLENSPRFVGHIRIFRGEAMGFGDRDCNGKCKSRRTVALREGVEKALNKLVHDHMKMIAIPNLRLVRSFFYVTLTKWNVWLGKRCLHWSNRRNRTNLRNRFNKFRDRTEEAKDPKKGDHGYDNRLEQMKAIFIAYGPSVQMNHIAKPFQNIELYNFFASM